MNALHNALERWWRPFLFFLWIWSLTGLLKNQRYTAFLRPEFRYVLALGVFALLGFLVTEILETRRRPLGVQQMLTGLILILPLVYLLNAQGATLGNYAFQNRSLGIPSLADTEEGNAPPSPSILAALPHTTPPAKPNNATDQNPAQPNATETAPTPSTEEHRLDANNTVLPVTVLDLYQAPGAYQGRRVRLTGMVHRDDPQVEKDFGPGHLIVFRFVITCCVADALPAAVLVDTGDALPDCEENTWVELEGRFTTKEKDGSRIPFVENPTIIPTEEPKQAYLF